MSDGSERWDEDSEYLYSRAERIGIRPTHADEEHFCERVAIMVIDGNIEEPEARRRTFEEMYGAKR